ncbi:hypothetical protein CEXT_328161 [Caerostris extrusa]|uniref:Uncharacterized protein n=1 Tax=Caerostris extrusa TaxID=172846 RepID=A0AAV4XI68_CAEEX|nr:hypothetical protein CEXT_328161 [Caerostris extrusa]
MGLGDLERMVKRSLFCINKLIARQKFYTYFLESRRRQILSPSRRSTKGNQISFLERTWVFGIRINTHSRFYLWGPKSGKMSLPESCKHVWDVPGLQGGREEAAKSKAPDLSLQSHEIEMRYRLS